MAGYSLPLAAICTLVIVVTSSAIAQTDQSESADGETIVLLTVKPKDPFSGRLTVVYVKEAMSEGEARLHTRSNWRLRSSINQQDSWMYLAQNVPLMTRRKLVESTLGAYAASGFRRSDIRIDVLATGAAARPVPPTTRKAAATPAVREVDPLAKKFGCTACHQIDAKLLGPSFRNIASKYNAGQAPVDTLFEYLTSPPIETGRKGTCSFNVPKNDEARALVKWVLAQ